MLWKIRASRKALPTTYELYRDLSPHSQLLNAVGGFCDAYEGTLSVKVRIKRLRISITSDREKVGEAP